MGLSWGLKGTDRFNQIHWSCPGSFTNSSKLEFFLSLVSTQVTAFPESPPKHPPPPLSPQLSHHRQDHQSSGPGPGPHSCPRMFGSCAGKRRSSHLWYSQPCHCHHRHPVHSQEGESPAQSAEAVHQSAVSLSEAVQPPGWKEDRQHRRI